MLKRRTGGEAEAKVGLLEQQDDPNNHLNRIYKLSTIDELMKGFGINQNKPRSQRGDSNAVLPSLPPPPRSSRPDKFREYESLTQQRQSIPS